MMELQVGHPETLRFLGAIPGTVSDERAWQTRFALYCKRGEWFWPDVSLVKAIAWALKEFDDTAHYSPSL